MTEPWMAEWLEHFMTEMEDQLSMRDEIVLTQIKNTLEGGTSDSPA